MKNKDQAKPTERGLYGKYTVYRNDEHGTAGDRVSTVLMVLDERDPAALMAALGYAVASSNTGFAIDLLAYVRAQLDVGLLKWHKTHYSPNDVRQAYEKTRALVEARAKQDQ